MQSGARVSWDQICLSKHGGGLGFWKLWFVEHYLYSKVCLEASAKIWFSLNRLDYSYPLRRGSIWSATPSSNCTYANTRYQIGNGQSTYLWTDHWHPHRFLLVGYPRRALYDAALPISARIADIISDSDWSFPSARSYAVVAILACNMWFTYATFCFGR